MQRLEFTTPTPPVGLPELPGPPSDEVKIETSVSTNGETNPLATSLSTMKTPQFPGAFGTPVRPLAPISGVMLEEHVVLEQMETTPKLEHVDPVSWFQGYGGGTPSPAPPGGYRGTPTPMKRKGILKVRFDEDVQTSEAPVNGSTVEVGTLNGVTIKSKAFSLSPPLSSEDVPPLSLSSSRRKGLRLVDEYGRERRFTEDGEEIVLDSWRKKVSTNESRQLTPLEDMALTPKTRTKMRQVDALGNEVAGGIEAAEPKVDLREARSKKTVISGLTRSLRELKHELEQEEEACVLRVVFPFICLDDNSCNFVFCSA